MYELLVLSLLMRWPLYAYKIAKFANEIIGPEEHISTGTLSTLLARLFRAGLLEQAEEGSSPFPADRAARAYCLTQLGRERFFVLMLDTSSHPGTYSKLFHIKALHLEFLPLDRQLFLVEHYLDHCRQLLRSKHADAQRVRDIALRQKHVSVELQAGAQSYIQLKSDQWQLELAWVQSLREQLFALLRQSEQHLSPVRDDITSS